MTDLPKRAITTPTMPKMTQEEMDEKEFEEYWDSLNSKPRDNCSCDEYERIRLRKMLAYNYWLASRRILREKIKSDPNIGRLEVEEWPESPDY